MNNKLVAHATTTINAPASRVWDALTDPEQIKHFMFGSQVVTDWKPGSPIIFKGEWNGQPFEDKGKIISIEPEKHLHMTYYSPMSGMPDVPENYHNVRYELSPDNGGTRLTVEQDNVASAEEQAQSSKTWELVLDGLKKLLEAN